MKILESRYYRPINYFVADRNRQFKVITDDKNRQQYPYSGVLAQSLSRIDMDDNDIVIHRDQLQQLEPCDDFTFLSYSKSKKAFYEAEMCYFHAEWEIFITISQDLSNDYDVQLFDNDLFKVANIFYDNAKPDIKIYVEQFFDQYLQHYMLGEKIAVLVKDGDYFELKTHKIKPLTVDIGRMYNDDFAATHEHIKHELSHSSKGIVLLHGLAGTGKTNYIRWLIPQVANKKFIFIPTTIIHQLTDPAFISILLQNKNSVLVLEDCENYLSERTVDNQHTDVVASILNLADGMLSDIVECQMICTFNASIDKIDTALLRKGRLIAEYKFKELSVDKANAYLQAIGSDKHVDKPQSLAELTNIDDQAYKEQLPEKTKLGFI